MRAYSFRHLADAPLIETLGSRLAHGCINTAEVLGLINEADSRRLYLQEGYRSMFAFLIGKYHLSEDAAYKRIKAARAARRFPAIFHAVAEGRLHLAGIVLLAPHLTEETAAELLDAAVHKSKRQIEQIIAERYPRPDVPTLLRAIPSAAAPTSAPAVPASAQLPAIEPTAATRETVEPAPGPVEAPASRPKVTPLAPQRFALQVTIPKSTHDKLRYIQELLGHQVPSGDLAEVVDRALDALIEKLEKRKFAATNSPRNDRTTESTRHVPAHVKRAVWERDQGQCTFVGENGRRCDARGDLEYDHADPVARGGRATVANTRLLCRAHNQYEAERVFGADFMRGKREAARKGPEAGVTRQAPSAAIAASQRAT